MHLDVKTFNDSSENKSIIQRVVARAGVSYGVSIELHCPLLNTNEVIQTLKEAGISFESKGLSTLTIMAKALYQREEIRKAFTALKDAHLISEAFVEQISENFPNGCGGINSLKNTKFETDFLTSFPSLYKEEGKQERAKNTFFTTEKPKSVSQSNSSSSKKVFKSNPSMSELESMPLEELEAFTSKQTEEYIALLEKKTSLEHTAKNGSLDDKTRCEASLELLPMLDSFHQLGVKHLRNLQLLQSRLLSKTSKEQSDAFAQEEQDVSFRL